MASWFGIMIFLCEAVGKGPFLPTSVFICILHFQYNLLKDLWEHILILQNPGEIFILLKDEIDDETLETELIADNQRIRTQPAAWTKKIKCMKALGKKDIFYL